MADPLARNGSLTELPGANELTAVLPVNHVQHENDAQAPAGHREAVPLIPRGHRNRTLSGQEPWLQVVLIPLTLALAATLIGTAYAFLS